MLVEPGDGEFVPLVEPDDEEFGPLVEPDEEFGPLVELEDEEPVGPLDPTGEVLPEDEEPPFWYTPFASKV